MYIYIYIYIYIIQRGDEMSIYLFIKLGVERDSEQYICVYMCTLMKSVSLRKYTEQRNRVFSSLQCMYQI